MRRSPGDGFCRLRFNRFEFRTVENKNTNLPIYTLEVEFSNLQFQKLGISSLLGNDYDYEVMKA
jgi:hypothetical protein